MAGIFISYRRADSDGWAGRLRDALRARFGDLVFQDVDNIADGEVFSEVIDRALQNCNVALVVIGPNWATARDEHGRRLDHEEDWVRTETAMVLNRKIRVIPVLVGGARLPRAEDLPEELRSLTKRQAREIRSNSWDSDVALLAKQLEQIVGPPRKRTMWVYALPALAVVAAIGAFLAGRDTGQLAPDRAPPERTATAPVIPAPPTEAPRAAPNAPGPSGATADSPTREEPETAAVPKPETRAAPKPELRAAPGATERGAQTERIPAPAPAPQPKIRRAAPPAEPSAPAAESGQPRIAKPAPRGERPLAAGDVTAPAREAPTR